MTSNLSWMVPGIALMLAGSVVAQQPPEVRRVVTKLDPTGKAVVMFDGAVQLKGFRSPNPAGEMWVTDKSLPDFNWSADRALTKVGLVPPKNGTIFRIVDFVPLSPGAEEKMDINLMMKVVGDHAPAKGFPPRHPMMHRTRSLDYAIIMSGEIDMLLDEGEVHLKAGDVVVQQATNHAWVNRSGKPCRVAFILMDSQEP
ncbi:MAG: cupin domain-containing protein [Betaproteobacteria bacterium]|jgi:mannose-6-phosphate isomerase-like protein (cupin superfamily)|nr:MAG: cupin domain-containing protein [Betaproteobacteria bacterium]